MSNSVNRVILIGNVARDPEIRTTNDGKEIANFTLVTSERWVDKNSGEKKEKAEFHKVTVFNQGLAAIVRQYVHKGSKLYVEGSLQTRKYTDKEGVEKYSTEIVLQNFGGQIVLLSKREEMPSESSGYESVQSDSRSAEPELNDEIPF